MSLQPSEPKAAVNLAPTPDTVTTGPITRLAQGLCVAVAGT